MGESKRHISLKSFVANIEAGLSLFYEQRDEFPNVLT